MKQKSRGCPPAPPNTTTPATSTQNTEMKMQTTDDEVNPDLAEPGDANPEVSNVSPDTPRFFPRHAKARRKVGKIGNPLPLLVSELSKRKGTGR